MKDLKDESINEIIIQEFADLYITDLSDYLRISTDIETLQDKVIELENKLTARIVKLESKVSYKLFDIIKFIKSL